MSRASRWRRQQMLETRGPRVETRPLLLMSIRVLGKPTMVWRGRLRGGRLPRAMRAAFQSAAPAKVWLEPVKRR